MHADTAPSTHRYGPHPSQFGELWLPAGRHRLPTVVIVHGGFWRARWDLSLGRPLAADLVARGHPVWNLEYRRVGAGGGWPATLADVAAGIDALGRLGVDTGRLVAIGHSAGGQLATWAAGRAALPAGAVGAEPAVALTGVVSQAGVLAMAEAAGADLGGGAVVDLVGGTPHEHPERYRTCDPVAAVPLPVPVLCLHSRADDAVPFAQSEAYVAAARSAGADATLIETGGDHFTLIDPASAEWALVTDAIEGGLG